MIASSTGSIEARVEGLAYLEKQGKLGRPSLHFLQVLLLPGHVLSLNPGLAVIQEPGAVSSESRMAPSRALFHRLSEAHVHARRRESAQAPSIPPDHPRINVDYVRSFRLEGVHNQLHSHTAAAPDLHDFAAGRE